MNHLLRFPALAAALLALGLISASAPAHAIFSDTEARNAILDLRKEVRESKEQQAQREAALQAALEQSQRAQLDLLQKITELQQEMAALRGQIEVQSRGVTETQQRQKDLYRDLDERLKRFEPQPMAVDGQEVMVNPAERQAFEQAQTQFRAGQFELARDAFSRFVLQHPSSPLAPQATFFLGNAHYALKDFRSSANTQLQLVKTWPASGRAPDALLVAAGAQVELNDRRGARATLERLIADYGQSPAAATAKERLALLKP